MAPPVTHNKTVLSLGRKVVDIIEFSKGLFNKDSVVLMPAKLGSEGGPTNPIADVAALMERSGIYCLAAVYKQFDFDPQMRLVIAAHSNDDTGGMKEQFAISAKRAEGVYSLLMGNKKRWAELAEAQHKVEDIKRVLAFINLRRKGWQCGPEDFSGNWDNEKTTKAMANFIAGYNKDHPKTKLDPKLTDKIKADKKWPKAVWEAVGELYLEEVCELLKIKPAPKKKLPDLKRLPTKNLKFAKSIKPAVPCLACGPSFPLTVPGLDPNSDYRKDKYRRVEALFFKERQVPGFDKLGRKFECQDTDSATHERAKCPIWYVHHLKANYISPTQAVGAVAYHLKLTYYNRIKQAVLPVPEGLTIQAYHYLVDTKAKDLIDTVTKYDNGVYTVQVPDADKNSKPPRTGIYFEFVTFDAANPTVVQWIYTESKTKEPKIIKKLAATVGGAIALERLKHYFLPLNWSSQNYWTRYLTGGNQKKADIFQAVMKTGLKLKPHGSSATSPSKPLTFSLDDIVLLDDTGSQTIFDRTADTSVDLKGTKKSLGKRSRVRVLHVDPSHPDAADKPPQLKIFELDPSNADVAARYASSLIRFQKDGAGKYHNIIPDPPGGIRAVVFCGEFYDVSWKRTSEDAKFKFSKGHVLGARAAILNDGDCHLPKEVKFNDATKIVHCSQIGDFDLHYLHGGGVFKGASCSYMVIYWSSFVAKDTKPTVGSPDADKKPATKAQVEAFKNVGMINSMNHWNKKEYRFEDNAATDKHIIQPFVMFEANEEFKLKLAAPVDYTADNYTAVFKKAKFKDALKKARGGRPKSIAYITEENKGSWMLSSKGGANSPLSICSLRIKTVADDTGRFTAGAFLSGTTFPVGDFNDSGFGKWEFDTVSKSWKYVTPPANTNYGCLAMAHELGHATGQVDDYTEMAKDNTAAAAADRFTSWVPSYGQFGVKADGNWIYHNNSQFGDRVQGSDAYALKHDDKTMMDKNGPIRMRQIWRFVHWLNEEGKATKPLNKFLNATQFEIRNYHPAAPTPMKYFRTAGQKKDPWQFSHSATIYAKTAPANERPINVYLYQGLDETRRLGGVEFRAILAVRPLFAVKFDDNGQPAWTKAEKLNWAYFLNEYFTTAKNLLPSKFKLSHAGAGDLNPTLLHFLPGFDFYTGANPAHNFCNYRLIVKKADNSFAAAGTVAAGFTITMGDHGDNMKELFYYLFNKPKTAAGFVVGDFAYIKSWFNSSVVPAGTFAVAAV